MGIYLDANVLWGWRSFGEPDRLAVSIVARQLGQRVFLPWVAFREAAEAYRRSLESAVAGIEQAHSLAERRFGADFELILEPEPDVEAGVELWKRRLGEVVEVLPLCETDLREAWEREIRGTPPAKPREPNKPGRGGRDAAVWLAVARHHAAGSEEGHFVCKDRTDFSDGQGALHPLLAEELRGGQYALHLYPSIPDFLVKLGTAADGLEVTLDELRECAEAAIKAGLRESLEIPHAVWRELDPELRYSTAVKELRPIEILSQRRYAQGSDAIVVVDARWEVALDACYQRRDAATPDLWNAIRDVDATGNIQVLLEERSGGPHAQFIGAQMASKTYLFFSADGSVVSLTSVDD